MLVLMTREKDEQRDLCVTGLNDVGNYASRESGEQFVEFQVSCQWQRKWSLQQRKV